MKARSKHGYQEKSMQKKAGRKEGLQKNGNGIGNKPVGKRRQ